MLCTKAATTRMAVTRTSRRHAVVVKCTASGAEAPARRAVLLAGVASLAAAAAGPALAVDVKEMQRRKEARKARLKEAAGEIKSTGKDQQVFKKSSYSMPDDAHTPNVHTRQNEGARTQDNV